MPKQEPILKYRDRPGGTTFRSAVSISGPATGNADTVDGFHAAASPIANTLLALDGDAKLPTDITGDADTVDGYEGSEFAALAEAETITGSWTFNANVSAGAGITFDGVDIGDHSARHESGGADTIDHDDLVGFVADEHVAHSGVTLTAGNGLTGGGTIAASRTFHVGAGDGIDVAADSVAVDVTDILGNGLGETSNNIYVYALRQSDDGANALAADADGDMTAYGGLTFNIGETITTAAGNLTLASAANLYIQPGGGDIFLDPSGDNIYPVTNYDLNLGALSKKFLTIHAAELWVETLVAQDTIATIGGRVLVGPTTMLASDLESANEVENAGFETAGTGDPDIFASWTETASDGLIDDEGSIVYEGSHACKFRAGASVDTRVAQNFSVSAGDSYTLSFAARGDGTYAGRYLVYDVTNSANIIGATATGVTGTSYALVYDAFVVPAGCTEISLLLYCPATNGGSAYFDAVKLINSTISVEHNEMAADSTGTGGKAGWTDDGDVAYMEANGKVEFFYIISGPTGSGPYTYGTHRNLDGTGANDWYAGDAVFNTGATGEGFIDLYSVHGIKSGTEYGPTIVGNVRASITYNDWTEHWAIGNLDGLYGVGTTRYGVGLGKYASNEANVVIDATDGLQMRSYTTVKFLLEPDGDLFIGTDISAAGTTNLAIFTNAQTYNSESVAAGDILIGDNSNNKANIYWDYSEGELLFRGGTDTQLVLGTDGSLTAGDDRISINATGFWADDGTNAVLGFSSDSSGAISWGGFSVAVGDLVLGHNKADKAAIFWDASAGTFGFYGDGESDPTLVIDNTGALLAGDGVIKLSAAGNLLIEAEGDDADDQHGIVWQDDFTSANDVAWIRPEYDDPHNMLFQAKGTIELCAGFTTVATWRDIVIRHKYDDGGDGETRMTIRCKPEDQQVRMHENIGGGALVVTSVNGTNQPVLYLKQGTTGQPAIEFNGGTSTATLDAVAGKILIKVGASTYVIPYYSYT